jgi:murein DD-endopeptidase MepM/ murein hydrolase activator NlpD
LNNYLYALINTDMKNLFFRLKEIKYLVVLLLLALLGISCDNTSDKDSSELSPIRIVTEINTGESQDLTLSNGETVNLKLLQIDVVRDDLRNAIRSVNVKISVDDEEITLKSGNYNLPVTIGKVQIDCPFIKEYNANTTKNRWNITKDARIRLWPKGSPYIKPGTFVYPIKQEWLASMSQLGNEPTYVDWGEHPRDKKIYYHSGHDIGGAEGMDEIISATDGLVVAANNETLEGYDDFPGDIRVDVVYIKNELGWFIRYSHLDSTDPAIIPGSRVKMGQKIGYIGKQGGSGGWVHLHFEMKNKETVSGNWGTEDAYPYMWESYVNQYKPDIIAVARPHHLLWTGQETTLDGSKSKSFAGDIVSYEWTFCDGTIAKGPIQTKSYDKPGEYSEILKVTDSEGNVDYDFTIVQVYTRDNPEETIPVLQPAYHPSLNLKPGDSITFLVRTFNTAVSNEVWDFGDGSPTVTVKSETVDRNNFQQGKFAEAIHSYSEPGDYIVRVERLDESGVKAIGHLHVTIVKD